MNLTLNNIVIKDKIRTSMIYIASFIIGILNVLFITNRTFAYILIFSEVLILLINLFRKKITAFLGCYLIFLSISIEFDVFVGSESFYSFKNFRLFGFNLGILMLIPIVILALLNFNKIITKIKEMRIFKKFLIGFLILNLIGILQGLLMLLVNDNNIILMDAFISSFINECYSMVLFPWMVILSFLYAYIKEPKMINNLKKYILGVFIGVITSTATSYVFKIYGYYGGVETLLISSVYFIFPIFILYCFYKTNITTILLFPIVLIFTYLILKYNSNGKFIILIGLVVIVAIFLIYKKSKKNLIRLFLIVVPLFVVLVIVLVQLRLFLNPTSLIFKIKFEQVLSMIEFWKPDWFANMEESPKYRIGEFANIFIEYVNKPYYALFGKGYMGTFKDYLGAFGADFSESGFSIAEWLNSSFYGVHETLNSLFLCNGLIGLTYFCYVIKLLIKNFHKSFYFLLGAIWFLIFYGYSVTLAALGLISLCVGFLDIYFSKGIIDEVI